MVRIADWVSLADSTVRGIHVRELRSFYEQEWPETLRSLTAEHREQLERNRKRLPRFLHTFHALLYGLSKRLAPQRRIVFGVALLVAIFTAFRIISQAQFLSVTTVLGLLLPSLMLMFVLAMELMDKIRFRDELQLARDLQKGLMPEELPAVPRIELAAWNRVANTVGGDLYDFVPLPGGRLAVLFGDASGHGMAAGLLMAVAHAAFRTQLEIDPEPEAIVGSLNRILCRTGGKRSFFTCCYILMEEDGRFRCSVAGHPPVIHLRADGAIERHIGSGSYPLGIRTAAAWSVEQGILKAGDTLVLYSDGLVEARSQEGTEYGYDRAEGVISVAARPSAGEMLEAILADWRWFTLDRAIEDDVSVAVVRRTAA
jgi:hypothetical protein